MQLWLLSISTLHRKKSEPVFFYKDVKVTMVTADFFCVISRNNPNIVDVTSIKLDEFMNNLKISE